MSGRYHRGRDQVEDDQPWAALYTATRPEIALAELMRHITPELLPFLNDFRLSMLEVSLTFVVDLGYLTTDRSLAKHLVDDGDQRFTQEIGRAAFDHKCEGLIVPSATRLGANLVVFPENVRQSSQIRILDSVDPRLRIEQ